MAKTKGASRRSSSSSSRGKKNRKPVNLRFPPKDMRFPKGTMVQGSGCIVDTRMALESTGSILYYVVEYKDTGTRTEATHEQLQPLVGGGGDEKDAAALPTTVVDDKDKVVPVQNPRAHAVNTKEGPSVSIHHKTVTPPTAAKQDSKPPLSSSFFLSASPFSSSASTPRVGFIST